MSGACLEAALYSCAEVRGDFWFSKRTDNRLREQALVRGQTLRQPIISRSNLSANRTEILSALYGGHEPDAEKFSLP